MTLRHQRGDGRSIDERSRRNRDTSGGAVPDMLIDRQDPPRWAGVADGADRMAASKSGERLLQLALSVIAVLPLALFSVGQFVSYDGYWHVFIANHDRWSNFWYDVRVNAHPPLFYAALGQVLALGKTALVYRAINIVATIACTYLVGRIVRRCGASQAVSLAASVAFALSLSTLGVALEVRSYMLSALFSLVGFRGFLDLNDAAFAERIPGARLSFALGMFLALMSHYSAAFVLAGCLAVPVVQSLRSSAEARRIWNGLRSRRTANIVTICVPLIGLLLAATHTILFGPPNHLPEFVHDPARESALAFLATQTTNLVQLFAPFANRPAQVTVASALVVITVVAAVIVRLANRQRLAASTPTIVTVVIGVLLALAGLSARYPFGGELRHQYVLFPFLVVTVCVAVGVLVNRLTTAWARSAVTLVFVAAVGANVAIALDTFPRISGRLLQAEMDRFRSAFPSPRVVYLDQFNLIAFFMHYDDWDWKYIGRTERLELYRVSREGQAFLVCRDLDAWVVNLADARVYRNLEGCRRAAGVDSVTLFALEKGLATPVPAAEPNPERTLRRLANDAGLSVQRLVLTGSNVFAEYGRAEPGATAQTTPSMPAR